MELINTSIRYQMEPTTGDTTSVIVGLSGKSDKIEVSANLTITDSDLESGTTLDDLSKKQLSAIAAKKLPGLLPKLGYSNYQFFVSNDKPVRLTAYSDLNDNGSYISLNANLDSSDFQEKSIDSVGYADVKEAVQTILSQAFPAS